MAQESIDDGLPFLFVLAIYNAVMKPTVSMSALLVILAISAASAGGIQVVDGDGLHLGAERVRLWGIDAPERDQTCVLADAPYPCGLMAKNALAELVEGQAVRCDPVDTDRYGRTVARCFADGKDLGGELVRLGWAVEYRRYSKGFYEALEADARRHRRGVWAGTFEEPSAWRRSH